MHKLLDEQGLDSLSFFPVDEEMLEEKLDMCTKYLFTLDKVERGLTKNRGE